MRRFRHLFIDLYGFNLYYIKCSRKEYSKQVKYEFDKTAPEKPSYARGTFEVYEKQGQGVSVIWLSEKATPSDLVHECFHATHFILDDKGMFLSNNSEEAYAYMLTHIFQKTKVIVK